MKTVQINLYSFQELSEYIQSILINEWRQRGLPSEDISFMYDEAKESLKEFMNMFNIQQGQTIFDFCNIDQKIIYLKGLRLRKWLLNNIWPIIQKGKYYSSAGYYDTNKKYHYKSRRSNCQKEISCPLSGVIYDMYLLEPIIKFVDNFPPLSHNKTIEDIISECIENIKQALDNEEDYLTSEAYISEQLQNNGEIYTKSGEEVFDTTH